MLHFTRFGALIFQFARLLSRLALDDLFFGHMDKARRDKRRANWKMSAPNLVKCSKCGALMMPHRVCKECGSYNKKEIVKVED